MKIMFKLLFAIASIFAVSNVAIARSESCSKTLVVSAAIEWPPYSWETDGQYQGIDIQIVEHLFSQLGYCWEFIAYPSSTRAFREFQKGNADVIFAASMTNERRRFAVFSEPYRQEDMRLIYHTEETRFEPYVDDATVVVNRGSFYGEQFAQFAQQCPDCVIELSLAYDRLKMVDKRRIQYAVEDYYAAEYLQSTSDIDNIIIADRSIHKNNVHFMFRPGVLSEQELTSFNETILVQQAMLDAMSQNFIAGYQ